MKEKRPALGRGLNSLLPGADGIHDSAPSRSTVQPVAPKPAAAVNEVALSEIEPNPYQPRTDFSPEALAELAESIRTFGVIQPITLRRIGIHKYQIISGERRFRASAAAGLTTIPAYIREADDQKMLEMAIVENIQREDLDDIETALSFQRLISECNLTQEQMADRVGKKRATVANYLRLLNLPAAVQKELKEKALSMGHAKVLLSIEDEVLMMNLCAQCIAGGWSVRMLEEKVRKALETAKDKKSQHEEDNSLPDEYYRVLEVVGKYFGNNISLKRDKSGKGSMTIRFNNDKEIAQFLKVLEENNI